MTACCRRMPWIMLTAMGLVAMVVGACGCDSGPPSPWKEMVLPLSNSTILPGAGPEVLNVKYKPGVSRVKAYLREYRSAIERAGYTFAAFGKNNDPGSDVHVLIFNKGEKRLRFTLAHDGPLLTAELKILPR